MASDPEQSGSDDSDSESTDSYIQRLEDENEALKKRLADPELHFCSSRRSY